MPTPTFVPLATITTSGLLQQVNFTSIPTSASGVPLRDLFLVVNGTPNANGTFQIFLNNDTGSNYNGVAMTAWDYGPNSTAFTDSNYPYTGYNTARPNMLTVDFLDYSASNKQKTFLAQNAANNGVVWTALRWANNAPITSVKVFYWSGNNEGRLSSGTTMSLYGIA